MGFWKDLFSWESEQAIPVESRYDGLVKALLPDSPQPDSIERDASCKIDVWVMRVDGQLVPFIAAQNVELVDNGALKVEMWRERESFYWERPLLDYHNPFPCRVLVDGWWRPRVDRVGYVCKVFAPGEWTGYETKQEESA